MGELLNSGLLIRPAIEADLPQIIALDQALFGWYGAAESPTVIRRRLALFPEGFIVLAKQGQVLGYGSAEKWLQQREPALDEDPSVTHHPDGQTSGFKLVLQDDDKRHNIV